jgi:hypothetical protein
MMFRRLTVPIVAVSLLFLATCCPSLWLTVTRVDPPTQPPLSVSEQDIVDVDPIVVPAHMDNRFDVFGWQPGPGSAPGAPIRGPKTPGVPLVRFFEYDEGKTSARSTRALEDILTLYGNLPSSPHPPPPPPPSPMLTFIHLSDVQVRDPTVQLGDKTLSAGLDRIIPSVQYDQDMGYYGHFVVESIFATINKAVPAPPQVGGPDARYSSSTSVAVAPKSGAALGASDVSGVGPAMPPSLLIHTGDAIDSGVTTELRAFHRYVDNLEIPFFDVLGNHDVLTFGNFLPTKRDNDHRCVTATSVVEVGTSDPWLLDALTGRICVDDEILKDPFVPTDGGLPSSDPTLQSVDLIAGSRHSESRENFIKVVTHIDADRKISRLYPPIAPPEPDDERVEALSVCLLGKDAWPIASKAHGLDLNTNAQLNDRTPPPVCQPRTDLIPKAPHVGDLVCTDPGAEEEAGTGVLPKPVGYYAFVQSVPIGNERRRVVFIALDTNDLHKDEGGSSGRIGTGQMKWLEGALRCLEKQDLVFVFGHHPLKDIQTDIPESDREKGDIKDLGTLLRRTPNIVAYFYGHEHRHGICKDWSQKDHPETCSKFWEVETGSIIEYPQEGRLVQLKYVGGGLAFLEVSVFKERLANPDGDLAKIVQTARRGAERDYCHSYGDMFCSPDKRVIYRTDGWYSNARLFFRLPGS